MLNEMLKLRCTLRQLSIEVSLKHGDVKAPGKRALLCIVLANDGSVSQIETRTPEEAQQHWTLRDGNHNSFPHTQVRPALRSGLAEEDLVKVSNSKLAFDERLAFFKILVGRSIVNEEVIAGFPLPSFSTRMGERAKALQSLMGGDGEPALRLFQFAADFPGKQILGKVDVALQTELDRNPSKGLLELGIALLFLPISCDILWDWEDPKSGKRAAAPRMAVKVSQALSSNIGGQGVPEICAMTGREAILEDNKFPQANLPILGPTYLHARNPQSPCASRYGQSGVKSMPVTRSLCGELQAAIEYLTGPEKKGVTWNSIPSEKPGQSDILISYIDDDLNVDAISCLENDEASFEVLAGRISKLADGKNLYIPRDANMEAFIIRKIDTANKKVIFTGSYSIRGFLDAAKDWDAGFRNLDEFSISLPPQTKGQPPSFATIRRLAPASVTAMLRRHFRKDGTEHSDVVSIPFSLAFRLFLEPRDQVMPIAARILHLANERFKKLLFGVGQAMRGPIDDIKPFNRPMARDAVSLLALLLWKMNRKKELFMNDTAYQIGQLLSAADKLHYGYCLDQRSGSIPPTLLGNSLLTLAEKNPTGALSQLLTRVKPYYGWANKARSGNLNANIEKAQSEGASESIKKTRIDRAYKIKAGAFAPIAMASIAAELHGNLSSATLDDIFRAELLLGYLAGIPRKENDSDIHSSSHQ